MNNEPDADIMKLISENSSSDEFITKTPKNPLMNSISAKILQRADELTKAAKIEENQKMKGLLKMADEKAEKNSKYTRKLNK